MLNNEGCEVYITGDINIDFFPIQYQQPNIGNVDMLLSLGYLTIIPSARVRYEMLNSQRGA